MDDGKKATLEAAGWRVGSAEEFLALTPQEAAHVDLRISRSNHPRER